MLILPRLKVLVPLYTLKRAKVKLFSPTIYRALPPRVISMLAFIIILYYFLVEKINFRYLVILLFIGIVNFYSIENKNLSIKKSYYNIAYRQGENKGINVMLRRYGYVNKKTSQSKV